MSIWDDPAVKVNDDYIKFSDIGDKVTGRILAITKHQFEDGKVVPQLLLDVDGEEKTLTAGQIRLKAELAEKRPEVGDLLTIELTQVEKRQGGRTLKHFDVVVNPGTGATPAQAATPAAAQSATPAAVPAPAASAATVTIPDNPTPEEAAALKALGLG